MALCPVSSRCHPSTRQRATTQPPCGTSPPRRAPLHRAALRGTEKRSSPPRPTQLPGTRPPIPPVRPSPGRRRSPSGSRSRRQQRDLLPRTAAPPLPSGAGTAQPGGPAAPGRGGPAAPGALRSPARGRPRGTISRAASIFVIKKAWKTTQLLHRLCLNPTRSSGYVALPGTGGVVFLAIGHKWWHSVVPMNVLSGPAAVTRERNSALPSAPREESQPPES